MESILFAGIFGTIIGVLSGLVLAILYKHLHERRSRQREQLAVFITTLSRLTLADIRRLFPKQFFPRWIIFSRREKVNWLNYLLIKAWPFLNKAFSSVLKVSLESTLELYKPVVFASLKFRKFTLGTIPPQISGLEIIKSQEDEITMEIDFQWTGNPSIILLVQTLVGVSLPIQVKNVHFAGIFRLIFKPLCDEIPCFRTVIYSLRELVSLDFDLKVVGGNVSSIPGLHGLVEALIKTAITDSLIWPMRQIFQVLPGDYREFELRITGVLEVKLVQAKNLLNKDIIGKSDPFVILYVRPIPSRMKKSRTINNDLNPIWNEHFKIEVEDIFTQSLFLRVLDEEELQQAEFLGCAKVELKKLQPFKLTDVWIPLLDDFDMKDRNSLKDRGEVHLELCYFPFNEDEENPIAKRSSTSMKLTSLERVLTKKEESKKSPSITSLLSPSSMKEVSIIRGILSITVMRAEDLEASKFDKNSDPYVVLKMKKSGAIMRTKVVPRTNHPEWNEIFHIVVEDALHEMIIIEIWDHRTFNERFVGKCALTLTQLLKENESDVNMQLQGVKSGKIFLHLRWRNPSPSDPQFL